MSTDHKATDNMVEDQVTGEERDIDVEKNAHGHSEADDKDAPATTVPAGRQARRAHSRARLRAGTGFAPVACFPACTFSSATPTSIHY